MELLLKGLLVAVTAAGCCVVGAEPSGEEWPPKVQLDIYYESLCPDSRRFIVEQLEPTFLELGQYLDLNLIPYGKAVTTAQAGGGWTFTCQHGPDECSGNAKQACILDKVKAADVQVRLIACMMESGGQLSQCLQDEQVPVTTALDIVECSFGAEAEGSRLLHDAGVATKALDPPLNYVPWIVIDQVHDDVVQGAEYRLKSYLCANHLQQVPECQQDGRNGGM